MTPFFFCIPVWMWQTYSKLKSYQEFKCYEKVAWLRNRTKSMFSLQTIDHNQQAKIAHDHDANARDRAKSKHHPFLTRKDQFFNAQRFQQIVATYALGRANDLQPISFCLVLVVVIAAIVIAFLLHILMRDYHFFFGLEFET